MVKRLYVYILLCTDNSYYVGVTNNLENRMKQHNEGDNITSYTYFRRPCKLVYWEAVENPNKAIARETQIKKWGRAKKEALIHGDTNQLHQLAKCKNDSNHTFKPKD